MSRFIIRYRGEGERPRDTLDRIRGIKGVSVVEDSGRMVLVEAPEQPLRSALGSEVDWVISPDVTYEVPDTRKKVQRPPNSG